MKVNIKQSVETFFTYLRLSFFSFSRTINHDSIRELIWTVLPTLILMLLAGPSLYVLYHVDYLMRLQEPYIVIRVIGNQWFWTYEYFQFDFSNLTSNFDVNKISLTSIENFSFDSYMISELDLHQGQLRLLETDNPLVVPTCTALRFLVTSSDVLHCWAIPSLGIKIDACPGRINQVFSWILRPGEFYGQCSEICGVNHGFMPISLIAL